MRKRVLILRSLIWGLGLIALGCTSENLNGPFNVEVIRPVAGQKCQYVIKSAPLVTLSLPTDHDRCLGRRGLFE